MMCFFRIIFHCVVNITLDISYNKAIFIKHFQTFKKFNYDLKFNDVLGKEGPLLHSLAETAGHHKRQS